MMTDTVVVQISDCHLPAHPLEEYRGIRPHDCLKLLLKKVKVISPDLVLATGDLSEDGSRVSYESLRTYFGVLGVPVLALPGNHDDVDLLTEFFPGSPSDTIQVSTHGQWQIVRLNSCLPGKPEGQLSETTLLALECYLQCNSQHPVLIALHHQPVLMDSPWIDKYPLLEPEALLTLIDQHPNVKAVVWGHVHQVYTADRSGTAMLGGPSSAINGLRDAQKFTADTLLGPACRTLSLGVNGVLKTKLVRVG